MHHKNEIRLRNPEILLKYLNCVERVLYVDNRWMKDYNSLMANPLGEHEGLIKFLSSILKHLSEKDYNIFIESLPTEKDLKWEREETDCFILDSIISNWKDEENENVSYNILACPKFERVFNLKTKGKDSLGLLEGVTINNFEIHTNLPRIKISKNNIKPNNKKGKISNLKFLYTLPSDAKERVNCLKTINQDISWSELVPDPNYGVEIGNIGLYYISPIKITEIDSNPENMYQVSLKIEDFLGNKFEFLMTTKEYRNCLGEFPKVGKLREPLFCRSLNFQAVGENISHISKIEKISKKEFIEDSILSFVRFRSVVSKKEMNKIRKNHSLPKRVGEFKDDIFYLPRGFSLESIKVGLDYKKSKSQIPSSFFFLREFHELQKFCSYHKGYSHLLNPDEKDQIKYFKLIFSEDYPTGVHRSLLNDPVFKLKFYAKNKILDILCTSCFQYRKKIRTSQILPRCPVCQDSVLVALKNEEDFNLFKNEKDKTSDKEQEYYILSSLFQNFSKYLYYTINATRYARKTCVEILNELSIYLKNENDFFEKLFKIKQRYNRKEDIHNILYKLEKDGE